MAETSIEWTDVVWNPVRGCSLVSAGCKHCYAMRMAHRFSGPGQPYEGLTDLGPAGPRWNGAVRLVPEVLEQPLRWRKPRKVFVNSMSDLFHPGVPDWFVFAVWRVMGMTPQHTYQILTKRPDRMLAWLRRWADAGPAEVEPVMWRDGKHSSWVTHEQAKTVLASGRAKMFHEWVESLGAPPPGCCAPTYDWAEGPRWWPTVFPNVWLGVSVEDQAAADQRIPLLLQTPAAVRWLSMEPLLGPVDLSAFIGGPYVGLPGDVVEPNYNFGLHWVVAGGESGPGARPCHPSWAHSLRDRCTSAGVPFLWKQWGEFSWEYRQGCQHVAIYDDGSPVPDADFGQLSGYPKSDRRPVLMAKVGKRLAGRLLEGRLWNEFPEVRHVG